MDKFILGVYVLLAGLITAHAAPEYFETTVANEAGLVKALADWKGQALNLVITSTQPRITLSRPLNFTQQHEGTGFHFAEQLQLVCGKGVDTAVVMRSSGVTLNNVAISGCSSTALISELPPRLPLPRAQPNILQDAVFTGNRGHKGGAIHVHSGGLILSNVAFNGNEANLTGGAVYGGPDAILIVQECSFRDNHAVDGGAICLESSKYGGPQAAHYQDSLQIRDSTFVNNTAVIGGGALSVTQLKDSDAQLDGTLQLTRCNFTGNKATRGGAVWSLSAANISFEECAFENNLAADGGAMWIKSQSYANIFIQQGCRFSRNLASPAKLPEALWDTSYSGSGNGGALYAMGDLLINISSVTSLQTAPVFSINQADSDGGAFYCTQCLYILLNGSRWEANTAASGGAVSLDLVTGTSFVTRSIFSKNVASDKRLQADAASCGLGGGGAMCVKSISQNFTLSNNTFDSNRGNTGGAMYINQDACQLLKRTCSINVVGSRFIDNNAAMSGGALHSTDMSGMNSECLGGPAPTLTAVADLLLGCSHMSEVGKILATGVDTLLGAEDKYCGNTFAGNQVIMGYGPTVSTRIYCVLPTASLGRKQVPLAIAASSSKPAYGRGADGDKSDPNATVVVANDQPFQVLFRNYDYFLQRVNIDLPWVLLETVSTPELAVLAPIVNITKGAAELHNISVFGEYGNHLVQVMARDGNRSIASVNLKVKVRECMIGEVTAGRACRSCETDTMSQYSFDPNNHHLQACEQCPAGAKCRGWSVIPQPSYWHSSPRSPQVHQCILPQACDYEDSKLGSRQQILSDLHLQYREYLTLNDSQIEEYNQQQCARGYTGNLCGTCQPGYGRRGNRCLLCAAPTLARLAYTAVRLMEGVVIIGVIVVRLYYRKSKTGSTFFKTPGLVSSDGKVVGVLPIETVEGPMSPVASIVVDNKKGALSSIASIWRDSGDNMAVTFEILIIYLQLLALLKALPLQWPKVLYALLSSLSITEASVTWISIDCLWPEKATQTKAILRVVLSVISPALVWVAIMAAWTCWYLAKHRGRKPFNQYMTDAAILSAVQVITYYYPYITSTLLSVLTCKTLDVVGPVDVGTWREKVLKAVAPYGGWWMQNLQHKCWTGSHSYFALGFGIPALVVVAVVIPVSIVSFLVRARMGGLLDTKRFYIKFGYLYTDFRPPVYYWYSARFTLMLVLTGVVQALSYFGPVVQVTVFTLVLTVFMMLHLIVLPYKDAPMNTLFLVAMLTVLTSSYACFAFVTTTFASEAVVQLALNAVFITNISVLTGMVICLCAGMLPYVCKVGTYIKNVPDMLKHPSTPRKENLSKIEPPQLVNVHEEDMGARVA